MVAVLPGDVVCLDEASVKPGPGVVYTPTSARENTQEQTLTAIQGGALGHIETKDRTKKPKGDKKKGDSSEARLSTTHGWWVDTNTRRYIPTIDDLVIGQVTNRGVESYTVTLFSAHSASLPVLAFEGATRRNRPNLEVGALVYARVISADTWAEPEISCVDPITGKSEGMGELKRDPLREVSMVWPIRLGLARALYNPKHTLLSRIASHFPFEAAIGLNGLVWVRTSTAEQAVALGQILQAAEGMKCDPDTMEQDVDLHDEARQLPKQTQSRGELPEAEIQQYLPH
ncbi:exosome non-catalytic core subunit rrp40 [Malassezia yamatoensis]|uniref:Ribosomal RNA-processing protein 40 n=1 Tax=Malassezia yamatoensis TaxID=253288 RepID=A0AAJ5YV92_9BASI|nr:exosome non-catalytic core subunit rrp40 [Malassezia yamatoensis]